MLNCMSVLKLNLHLRIYVMLLEGKLQKKFPVYQNKIIIIIKKKQLGVSEMLYLTISLFQSP